MKKELDRNDIYQLNLEIAKTYGFDGFIRVNSRVELVDNSIVLIDNRPAWFRHAGRLVPTVQTLLDYNFLRKVYVENGAIPNIQTTRKVLRASVVRFERPIVKGQLVCVVNKKWDRPFGVGIALYSDKDMGKLKAGKVIDVIHCVGDRIWELMATL